MKPQIASWADPLTQTRTWRILNTALRASPPPGVHQTITHHCENGSRRWKKALECLRSDRFIKPCKMRSCGDGFPSITGAHRLSWNTSNPPHADTRMSVGMCLTIRVSFPVNVWTWVKQTHRIELKDDRVLVDFSHLCIINYSTGACVDVTSRWPVPYWRSAERR